MSERKHSEEYFDDSRDFWWNLDFLALMAQRWRLESATRVLDVGCGVGHWGRSLAPFLPKQCHLIGLDKEQEWVEKAQAAISNIGSLCGRFSYLRGDANQLPFADQSFDVVTCQTVLIHLEDPERALQEWMRVLKPGGLLAVTEPNNMANLMVSNSVNIHGPVEDLFDLIEFHLRSQRGKYHLGEGYNSIGDLLPGYFANAGLYDIQCYLSDKTLPMYPPYDHPEQIAAMDQMNAFIEKKLCIGNKDENLKYFLAGGGTADEFERLWQKNTEISPLKVQHSIELGTYHSAGSCMMYLVSGRKSQTILNAD